MSHPDGSPADDGPSDGGPSDRSGPVGDAHQADDALELAMFPLGSVLLPGMALPLRIFEPRYRAMMASLAEAPDPAFGVVLIERGSEVGGGETRTDVGCVAVVAEASQHHDGTWSVVAVGTERLRVREWLPDDPYPRARIELWPDPPDESAPAPTEDEDPVVALERRVRRVAALAVELGARGQLPDVGPRVREDERQRPGGRGSGGALSARPLSPDPTLRLYQLATLSPLGALDRRRLLATERRSDRTALLSELLDEQELLLRARLGFDDPA